MVFFLARMILISHLKVGFHIFNPFWLHSSSMAKVAFEGFCVDRSWSLPVSGAHLHRCSALGETFLQFCQTLPLPALLQYLKGLWLLFRQLPQFCCLTDYCIGSLLHLLDFSPLCVSQNRELVAQLVALFGRSEGQMGPGTCNSILG